MTHPSSETRVTLQEISSFPSTYAAADKNIGIETESVSGGGAKVKTSVGDGCPFGERVTAEAIAPVTFQIT